MYINNLAKHPWSLRHRKLTHTNDTSLLVSAKPTCERSHLYWAQQMIKCTLSDSRCSRSGVYGRCEKPGLRTSQTSRVGQEWLHLAVNQRTGCQTGREAQDRADAERGEGEQSVFHECCAYVWSKGYFRLARWQARWELVGQLQAGWSHEESYCGKRGSVVSRNHFRQVLSQSTVWWLWCKGGRE